MRTTFLSTLALPLALLVLWFGGAQQEKQGDGKAQQDKAAVDPNQAAITFQKPCYPLKKCVISGEELDKDAVDAVIDGRLVRTCCKDCVAKVEKDKAAVFAKIDAAVIEQQLKGYPLEKCPISGEKLGDTAVNYVHGTRLIRTCCPDCVAAVQKNPEPALKKLNDGYIAMQKASYPLDTCIVSGEKLGGMGEPIDYLYGTRLYRLCCGGCKKAVAKDADGLWKKIEEARVAKK